MKETLIGGAGDNRPDSAFDPKELAAGIKEEMEHTDSRAEAKEIAKDHLTKDKLYYRKLKRMVEKAVGGTVKAPMAPAAASKTPTIPKPPAARNAGMEKAMDPIIKAVLTGEKTPSQAVEGLPVEEQTRVLRELRKARQTPADALEKKYMGTWTSSGIQPGKAGVAPAGMKPGEAKPLGKTPEESEAHAKKMGMPSATGLAHPGEAAGRGGEGSRGGQVTGHTAAGRPTYGAKPSGAKPPPIPAAVRKGGPPAGSFKRIRDEIMSGPGKKPDDPDAVAAKVYRQKYGQATLTRRSAAARKSMAEEVIRGVPLAEVLEKALSAGGPELQVHVLRELRELRKSLQPGAAKPVGKDPLMKDKTKPEVQAKPSIGDKPSPEEAKKAKAQPPQKGQPQKGQTDDQEQEEAGPGDTEYHKDRALAHLAAAQAHANAHASAKKIDETADHKDKVKQAEEASAGAIKKGGMTVDLGAEDEVIRFLEGGGQVGGDFSALPDPRGVQRMAALRGGIMEKAEKAPQGQDDPGAGVAGGPIFQGEWDGPRGGDNRESAMRLREQMLTIEDDPAGNRGAGGLDEWFKDAFGNAQGIAQDVNVPVGPMSMVRMAKGEDAPLTIIDDDDPYTKALYRADPRDGGAGLRMAYQGNGRDNRRGQ